MSSRTGPGSRRASATGREPPHLSGSLESEQTPSLWRCPALLGKSWQRRVDFYALQMTVRRDWDSPDLPIRPAEGRVSSPSSNLDMVIASDFFTCPASARKGVVNNASEWDERPAAEGVCRRRQFIVFATSRHARFLVNRARIDRF